MEGPTVHPSFVVPYFIKLQSLDTQIDAVLFLSFHPKLLMAELIAVPSVVELKHKCDFVVDIWFHCCPNSIIVLTWAFNFESPFVTCGSLV